MIHNPAPWKYSIDYSVMIIEDCKDDRVAIYDGDNAQHVQNMEFVIKAVNNHESLLEALRIVLYSGSLDGIVPHNIIDKVRDAVTKAEGM